MALIKSVRGFTPEIDTSCFLADNATIIGQVTMGAHGSVWFNAVVRADVNSITIGTHVNIQDGAVLHATYKKAATKVGNYVSIGHNAIVHGCTIHDNVLIGMGSIVMDHCEIEPFSIIAAGAVLTQGTHVPTGSIFAGMPARKIKDCPTHLKEGEIQRIANNYGMYASWFNDAD